MDIIIDVALIALLVGVLLGMILHGKVHSPNSYKGTITAYVLVTVFLIMSILKAMGFWFV